jgi:hypothetical protein
MYVEYLQPEPKPYLPRLGEAIICDIDGTLAKMDGRGPFEEDKVKTDKPVLPIIDILNTFKKGKIIDIILMSGRHELARKDTQAWLQVHGVTYDKLYMRPDGDNQPDYIIKRKLYDDHIDGRYNVLFVLDDRNQVVDLWRSLGLKCLQVDYGDF